MPNGSNKNVPEKKDSIIDYIAPNFLKIYFYVAIIRTAITFYFYSPHIDSAEDYLQVFFSLFPYIPFYGYVYNKKMSSQSFWITFVTMYFLWEIWCYIDFKGTLIDNLKIFLMLSPEYWAVLFYALITVQEDSKKKNLIMSKRDAIVKKYKGFFMLWNSYAFFESFSYIEKMVFR